MIGSQPDDKPIGVVGLGLMGTAIVERLLASRYDVVVYNRTPDKAEPLIALGARWSDSPLEHCDRAIISLYTTEVVESVLEQMKSSLVAGKTLIDTTTGDPVKTPGLGERLAKLGVQYIEAPISGSSEQTRQHLATALAAGPDASVAACRDLFDCIAAKTYYVGDWGNGVRMKLVANLVLGLNRAALAEGLIFAHAIGLPADKALQVLLNSPAYSRTMDAKGPKMVAGDFSPQAKLSQHLKDVRLILDEASRSGQCLPLSSLHRELLEQAEAAGFGELDNSAIIRAIESLKPIRVSPF
jgi:3-hydroxyisobutyrate dehydrogenase-like beta-hydroxyacid dehydrogenase